MKIIRYEDPSGAFRYGNEQSDGKVLELSGDLFGFFEIDGKDRRSEEESRARSFDQFDWHRS